LSSIYFPTVQVDDVPNKNSLERHLRSWLSTLKLNSKSTYDYYVGKAIDGTFGDLPALRFLVIVPSEYIRDTQSEWDQFQLIVTYNDNPNDTSPKPDEKGWLTAKNYLHRSKGVLSPNAPSADWEFFKLDDTDTSNARLEQIAKSLRRVAEIESLVRKNANRKYDQIR
jgi:hypothetical protein